MHLHNCRCFQEHLRMLLQSLRKKRRNCNRRAMCNATRGIDAGPGVICHRGVSEGSDGARPLWRSHSARTEMFFADVFPRLPFASSRVPFSEHWLWSSPFCRLAREGKHFWRSENNTRHPPSSSMLHHREIYIEHTYRILTMPGCTQLRDWIWDAEWGSRLIETGLQLQAGTGSFPSSPSYSIEKLFHMTDFLVCGCGKQAQITRLHCTCQEGYNLQVRSLDTRTQNRHAAWDDVGRYTQGNLQAMLLELVFKAWSCHWHREHCNTRPRRRGFFSRWEAGVPSGELHSAFLGLSAAAHPAISEEYCGSWLELAGERPLPCCGLRGSGRSSKIDCQLSYIQPTLSCR